MESELYGDLFQSNHLGLKRLSTCWLQSFSMLFIGCSSQLVNALFHTASGITEKIPSTPCKCCSTCHSWCVLSCSSLSQALEEDVGMPNSMVSNYKLLNVGSSLMRFYSAIIICLPIAAGKVYLSGGTPYAVRVYRATRHVLQKIIVCVNFAHRSRCNAAIIWSQSIWIRHKRLSNR